MKPNPENGRIILSFRMEQPIPIKEPGSPLVAWGLCLMALVSAVSTLFAIMKW